MDVPAVGFSSDVRLPRLLLSVCVCVSLRLHSCAVDMAETSAEEGAELPHCNVELFDRWSFEDVEVPSIYQSYHHICSGEDEWIRCHYPCDCCQSLVNAELPLPP